MSDGRRCDCGAPIEPGAQNCSSCGRSIGERRADQDQTAAAGSSNPAPDDLDATLLIPASESTGRAERPQLSHLDDLLTRKDSVSPDAPTELIQQTEKRISRTDSETTEKTRDFRPSMDGSGVGQRTGDIQPGPQRTWIYHAVLIVDHRRHIWLSILLIASCVIFIVGWRGHRAERIGAEKEFKEEVARIYETSSNALSLDSDQVAFEAYVSALEDSQLDRQERSATRLAALKRLYPRSEWGRRAGNLLDGKRPLRAANSGTSSTDRNQP